MFLSFYFNWCWILNLRINSWFWSIWYPLSNKDFVFLSKKIRTLTLSHIIYPMTLKMISTSFSHYTITAPFSHKPHSLINISIFIYHSPLSMRQIIHPHSIVSITLFIEHCSSSLLWIVFPISCILSP